MIEAAVKPLTPLELPRLKGGDLVLQSRGAWLQRLLVVGEEVMVVRARASKTGQVVLAAEAVDPARLIGPGIGELREAGEEALEIGIARMRFSLGIDDDLNPFYRSFRGDPLLGPALRGRLQHRPQRRALPWEALLWAITEQLIEYRRAARIQRQMIRRFGLRLAEDRSRPGRGQERMALATVPTPQVIAAASPAELEACGLGARRAVAMVKVAREVAGGRVDPGNSDGDKRLLQIPEIGPWTVACLALRGRGEPDALLAGDLGQVKLVGFLSGLGRLAEVAEVEEFYSPYAPWRGLAGEYLLRSHGLAVHGPGNRTRIQQQAIRRAA